MSMSIRQSFAPPCVCRFPLATPRELRANRFTDLLVDFCQVAIGALAGDSPRDRANQAATGRADLIDARLVPRLHVNPLARECIATEVNAQPRIKGGDAMQGHLHEAARSRQLRGKGSVPNEIEPALRFARTQFHIERAMNAGLSLDIGAGDVLGNRLLALNLAAREFLKEVP
jgi:hypothetical protein